MSYIDEFIESMKFAGELGNSDIHAACDYNELKRYYLDTSGNHQLARFTQGPILDLAKEFVTRAPYDVANLCHSMSQQFFDRFTNTGLAKEFGLSISIGNVEYRGRKIFPTSKAHVIKTLEDGFNPEKPLDLHVWITTVNMFVLDLTIIPTLIAKGLAKPAEFKGKNVLVARNGIKKTLKYHPILHDDKFMYKVDRIAGFA